MADDAHITILEGAGLTYSLVSKLSLWAMFGPWVCIIDYAYDRSRGELVWGLTILACHSVVMVICTCVSRSRPQRQLLRSRDYWALTVIAAFSITCCALFTSHQGHIDVIVLDSLAFLRIALIHFAFITLLSLSPLKAW